MKNIFIIIMMFFLSPLAGYCNLSANEINVYNLKQDSIYMLDLEEKAESISVSDEHIIRIMPITSIDSDGKQLFIEAGRTGVCDVYIKTVSGDYQVRFITGNVFEDKKDELVRIDIPNMMKKEI